LEFTNLFKHLENLEKNNNMTESNRIEYKRELTNGLEKEVVAFLNYREGGIIYIGIDKNGSVVGLQDSDTIQLKIKDRLKNNIHPSCLGLFDVVNEQREGKDIIKLIIASGYEKPYYLKKYGMTAKGCYLRVGSASEPMDKDMIEDLFSRRTRDSLGKIVSNKQDLAFQQLKIYYQENGFDLNDSFLKNLDLYTPDEKFNYVAYLLADVNSASVKVAKYAGTNKADLIENEEYGFCSLLKATNSVLDKLDIENKTYTKITGKAERSERKMINSRALREALINAMVHNDYTKEVTPVVEIYSDRLSITSYGGLVHGLSKEEFFAGRSIPRNRELMRVFSDLKLVEQLGSGVHRILDVYDESIFKISDNFLEICFPFEQDYLDSLKGGAIGGVIGGAIGSAIDDLTDRQRDVLNLIIENNRISYKAIADKLGINESAVIKHIKALRDKEAIVRIGGTRGYWEIKDEK
jgi:predicted HTH transcriptional regulator